MRVLSSLAALSLGLVVSTGVLAVTGEEAQLIDSINIYRSKAQPCGGEASLELPPLNSDTRLALSPEGTRDLQQAMTRAAYPMVNVQAISLSGPRDARAAMHAIEESFCQVVLDPQFVDIGVSQEGRDWRIVLARPLLSGRLGDWQAEGQKVLQEINAARKVPRQCGGQPYAAAPALELEHGTGRGRRQPHAGHGQPELLRPHRQGWPHPRRPGGAGGLPVPASR